MRPLSRKRPRLLSRVDKIPCMCNEYKIDGFWSTRNSNLDSCIVRVWHRLLVPFARARMAGWWMKVSLQIPFILTCVYVCVCVYVCTHPSSLCPITQTKLDGAAFPAITNSLWPHVPVKHYCQVQQGRTNLLLIFYPRFHLWALGLVTSPGGISAQHCSTPSKRVAQLTQIPNCFNPSSPPALSFSKERITGERLTNLHRQQLLNAKGHSMFWGIVLGR